jgi:DeoR family transcriptional regulator, myo-inositol catabolism operon repressor
MKQDRLQQIEKYVKTHGKASMEELTAYFAVSPITIRRAVKELSERGALMKVYGGVMAATPLPPLPATLGDAGVISQIAASLVEDGDFIFLDEGPLVAQVVPLLTLKKDLTVITNSLSVLNAAINLYPLNVICPGGKLQQSTRTLVGILKDSFHCRKAFISAESASVEYGAANSNFYSGVAKRMAMESSDESYLLIDYAGFSSQSYNTFAKLSSFRGIVTDKHPPQRIVQYCMENDIRICCTL